MWSFLLSQNYDPMEKTGVIFCHSIVLVYSRVAISDMFEALQEISQQLFLFRDSALASLASDLVEYISDR